MKYFLIFISILALLNQNDLICDNPIKISNTDTIDVSNLNQYKTYQLDINKLELAIVPSSKIKQINDSLHLLINYSDLDSNEIRTSSKFKYITRYVFENRSNKKSFILLKRYSGTYFGNENYLQELLIYNNEILEDNYFICDTIEFKKRKFYEKHNSIMLTLEPNSTKTVYIVSDDLNNSYWQYSSLNSHLFDTQVNSQYKSLLILPLVIFFVILVFAIVLKVRIYWYYLIYLSTIVLFCLLNSDIPILLLDYKTAFELTNERNYFSILSLFYASLFKFLIEFLETKKYFNKWTIFINFSTYFSFIVGLISIILQNNQDDTLVVFTLIPPLMLFLVNTIFVIVATIKIYRRGNKNAIYIMIGWFPVVLSWFFMFSLHYSYNISFYVLIMVPLFYEMLVFLFGIAVYANTSIKDLSKKEIEKKLQEQEIALTRKLLLNVLPESIADRLKDGETTIVDHFESASILFIDIVGFTQMSVNEDPKRIVAALNEVFTKFDKLADKYGLEKIKTIGDSYMVAAGIPIALKDHALRACNMALEIKNEMQDYTIGNNKIEFRIGIDCGAVVAGVIGEKKFIYDLWSDAVNTASRMESTGVAGEIHITDNFKQELEKQSNNFKFHARETIDVKGKGQMQTWFVG